MTATRKIVFQGEPGANSHLASREAYPDYEPVPFYSSDTDMESDLDLAAWLADTSAPAPEGLSVAGFGAVIGEPAAAEAAVEAPATNVDADLGDATAS